MRTLLAVASVALLVGAGFGCGDDTTTTPVSDMTAVADMSAMPHDMQTLGCAQILMCQAACTTLACTAGCIQEGSTTAQTTFGALVNCLVNACNPDAGNPAGSCNGISDIMSASCQMCLKAAGAAAAQGGTCTTQYQACGSS